MMIFQSCEVQFEAMADNLSTLLVTPIVFEPWLTLLLKELQYLEDTRLQLHCDNPHAITLMKNPVLHTCTKHIVIHHHNICKQIQVGQLTWCTLQPQNKSQIS
jgi:hypothetical protein